MEKIKIGKVEFDLIVNGYQINKEGGKIIFRPRERTFEEVENIVKQADQLILLDGEGAPMESRTDLVYAGQLAKDTAYVIGVDGQGGDITGTVMIAEFREPDIREELAETNAKLDYVAMMADVEV